MVSRTSRRSYFSRRPPCRGLATGSSGSTCAHCASVSEVSYRDDAAARGGQVQTHTRPDPHRLTRDGQPPRRPSSTPSPTMTLGRDPVTQHPLSSPFTERIARKLTLNGIGAAVRTAVAEEAPGQAGEAP